MTIGRQIRGPPGHPAAVISHSLLRLALVTLVLSGSSCAVFESDNRRMLNLLDEHLTPSDPAAKWALAPIALPTGLAVASVDAAIVHPITVFDDAWGDTTELLWSPGVDESRFRRAVFTPLAAIATPAVFLGDWLGRSLFLIPPRQDDDGEPKEDDK